MTDELEVIAHGPGMAERRPRTCHCGKRIELVGAPGCSCATAQAGDGHHRHFYCGDVRCPGLRRGACELDPGDRLRWRPEVHGSR